MPKLQKSNDTFGESELNTVLMRLLGNDPSGNALSTTPLATVPLPATGGASLATLPLGTATLLPPTPTPTPAPTPTFTPAPTPTPTPTPAPTPALTPTLSPTIPSPPPLPTQAQLAVTQTGQLTLQTFGPNLPITGLPTAPPPSQPQLFPPGTAGAAFTSNPTPLLTDAEIAAQALAAQLAATNQPDLSLVINKPILGRKPEKTDDPEELKAQAARANVYILEKKRDDLAKRNETLNAEDAEELKQKRAIVNKLYKNRKEQLKLDKESDKKERESAESAGAAGGN